MDLNSSIQTAFDFISGAERFYPSPYWDVNGFAIGYGNHYYEDGSSVSVDDDPIDQARALQILQFYVSQNASAILSQVTTPLSDNQLAALTSLRYNCGTITSTLLNLVNSGADPSAIGSQIEKTCITSGGSVNPVLIARRRRESDLYQSSSGSLFPAGISPPSIILVAAIAISVYIISK